MKTLLKKLDTPLWAIPYIVATLTICGYFFHKDRIVPCLIGWAVISAAGTVHSWKYAKATAQQISEATRQECQQKEIILTKIRAAGL